MLVDLAHEPERIVPAVYHCEDVLVSRFLAGNVKRFFVGCIGIGLRLSRVFL
jgi:hypothetical protein